MVLGRGVLCIGNISGSGEQRSESNGEGSGNGRSPICPIISQGEAEAISRGTATVVGVFELSTIDV